MTVIEILNLVGRLSVGLEAFKIVKASLDFRALVDPRVVQSYDTCGTTSKGTVASVSELIVVAAIGVVTFSDVLSAAIDSVLGYVDASVAGSAQSHPLANGDR